MKEKLIFAESKLVTDLKECYFYHTIDLPGHGTINGSWDLRSMHEECFGGVPLADKKKVLEIGTANDELCFEMEKVKVLAKENNIDHLGFEVTGGEIASQRFNVNSLDFVNLKKTGFYIGNIYAKIFSKRIKKSIKMDIN